MKTFSSLIYTLLAPMTPMDRDNILKSLEIMWKGMLAIFIVIAVIIVLTYVLNRIEKGIWAKKQGKNETELPDNRDDSNQ